MQNDSWIFNEDENNFNSNEVFMNYEDENTDIFSSNQLILATPNEDQIDDNDFYDFNENVNDFNENLNEQNENVENVRNLKTTSDKKKISKEARKEMKNWLMSHWFYPYPQKNVINFFAQKYNLARKQVHTFFVNHRSRLLNRKGWGSKSIVIDMNYI